MRYEDPENDDLGEFGIGTDGSESVLNVDVLSTREQNDYCCRLGIEAGLQQEPVIGRR